MKIKQTTIPNQYQPAELHTYTEDLGIFVVTGIRQDLEHVLEDSFNECKHLSQSSFDRSVYGRYVKPKRKHLIEVALF
jgi:hypothetical protein